MASHRTQFSHKLYFAFGVLMLITLAVTWYFYDSVTWYEYDLQRITRSNAVLTGYHELSAQTHQKLNRMRDSVIRGSSAASGGSPEADIQALRRSLLGLRQGIMDEVAIGGADSERQELETLVGIERTVEEIIRIGAAVEQALTEGRQQDAEDELARLRSEGVVSQFNALLSQAVTQQESEVGAAHAEALALAQYIMRVLPALMSILVIVTIMIGFIFSRGLTRSVRVLHEAVAEFTKGNLKHRIPKINEREFFELGQAFNTMARELSEHRAGLHDANVRLEAMIDERTRALKESNLKLAQVDEKRRKLLADISHEFRTPLTVIRGESEIALRGDEKSGEEYRDSLQRIMEQADHTTRLVDDLLFIARADAGEPRLEVRSVAIVGLLEKVCEDFKTRAQQKDVSIVQSGKAKKAVVLGDPGRLRQVFTILLDNALRYSNAGGVIQVGIQTDQREITVTVRDQGIGLTQEEAAQAFQRFFRGRRALDHASGTGLGLPVAKVIVEAHQGRISLEGNPGEGALATVVLPIEDSLRAVA